MISKIKKPGFIGRRSSFGLMIFWLVMGFVLIGSDLYAQTYYEMTFNQRRMGNQIGVEVWMKTTDVANATNLGNMTINLKYNSTLLTPAGVTANGTTDSIKFDVVDSPSPYATITSPFGTAVYGFSTVSSNPTQGDSNSVTYKFYGLNIVLQSGGAGYKPATDGRGTFVGMVVFNINAIANTCSDLTNIQFSMHKFAGSQSIISAAGTDVTSQVTFTNQAPITVRGITLLSPNGPTQLINRYPDPAISCMLSYGNHGYPIYFERSGLIVDNSLGNYGTGRLAYGLQYSLDGGSNWADFGRVAETTQSASLISNKDLYRSGEVDTLNATYDYFITQGNGTSPITSGYGGVIRLIWKASENFALRSENAKIRLYQLDTTATAQATTISSRASLAVLAGDVCRSAQSSSSIVLGRLFFVQLDGSTSYFRTEQNYWNATQLTVEAWVNLNNIPSDSTGAPAIVASSAGPTTSDEGAWMLYLDKGKYPAFRCREIEGRGLTGDYLAIVKSPIALTTSDPSVPIQDSHAGNWTHIAATVNNNVVTLYINGEIVDQKINNNAVNIRMLTTNHPIWIGLNPNTIDNPNGPTGTFETKNYLYSGLKEVRVWRVALPQTILKNNISGVYDPNGSVTGINPNSADYRYALELDYTFQGTKLDIADNTEYQYSANTLDYYLLPSILATTSNNSVNFRPDRSHIKLTSPIGGEGISNLTGKDFEIRWAGYGLGKISSATKDIQIMLSRDGGISWFDAIDNSNMMMDNVEIEKGVAYWEPYRNATITNSANDLQGLTPITTDNNTIGGNYAKPTLLRISGTEARGQYNISDVSKAFTVAPNFSLKNLGNAYIEIPPTTSTNLSNGAGYIEAWIKPYRFPTTAEGYFPIISKIDPTTDSLHYSFRLLSSGRLQLAIGSLNGTYIRTATSDSLLPIIPPNSLVFDSSWVHVGVWFNLGNNGQSSVKFYINGTVQYSDSIQSQLGTGISVYTLNEYKGYLGYEPGTAPKTFIGELREIRIWGSNPGGQGYTGNEPTDLTKFIQGALTINTDELGSFSGNNYASGLKAAFMLTNGSFINNGFARSISVYPSNLNLTPVINGTTANISYAPTKPLIKLIEPIYNQSVANTVTNLKVRWAGFDFNRNATLPTFRNGTDATNNADLQYSVYGGGASADWQPWKFVASKKYSLGYTDAMSLPTSDNTYEFLGVSNKSQFASKLNVAMANPDVNADSVFNDQGSIPATMTNGKLRLRARASQNGSVFEFDNGTNGMMSSLISESEIFNITPPSNFTVRVLLEGYQKGSNASFATKTLGTTYATKGLKIQLFTNNANTPGTFIAKSESIYGYSSDATAQDPTASPVRGANGSQFANVPFVFTNIADGRYFVYVDQINHLPVLSRYAATFAYLGDDLTTWAIESGWDFQNWGGTSSAITETEAAAVPPTIGTNYTAYGNYSNDKTKSEWGNTGLNYNAGDHGNSSYPLAGMVGGDCYKDGQINAADRALVRLDDGGVANRSDVTGDGYVNSLDRDIVDRNNNKVSSVPSDLLVLSSGIMAPAKILPGSEALCEKLDANAAKYYGTNSKNKSMLETNTLSGGVSYNVYAYPTVNGQYVDVSLYIENTGADYALGHSTFGITYESTALEYSSLEQAKTVIFSNVESEGYSSIYSGPTNKTKQPIADIRTIEVDYDAYTQLDGQNVPHSQTYLGTLRFKILSSQLEYDFSWHKISAVLTTKGQDVTADGNFMPIQSIVTAKTATLTTPNGGENWLANKLYTISWTKPSADIPVYLEYTIDDGKSWNRINANPASILTLSYNWMLPKVSSSECLVRLVNANDNTEIDRSDAWFTISPAPAEITRPASTDAVYLGGASDAIKWNITGTIKVKFQFSENGDGDWYDVTPSGISSDLNQTNWTLPVVNSKYAVIRMVNSATNEVVATSGMFRILAGNVAITTPKAGDILTIGDNKQVRWNYNNVSRFDLQFSPDGGTSWEVVSNDVVALKGFDNWLIPMVKTQNGILRALYNNDPDLEYYRTGAFTIDGVLGVNNSDGQTFTFDNPVPNPFNGETKLHFSLPFAENVTIEVYNATGMKIATLANGQEFNAGANTVIFTGNNLPTGIYFIHLNAGLLNATRTAVLVK